MFAFVTSTRRWHRFIGRMGVVAMLFGLGMDVHATMMTGHGIHAHAVVADAGSPPAHEHGAGLPGHDHPVPGHAPEHPADGDSGFTCCSATVCPPVTSVLPIAACEPASAARSDSAPPSRIAGIAGVGHTPLLRPPR